MTLTLALCSLLLFGTTRALAGVRGAVRGPGVVRQRAVVFRAAFGGPFYWDPFWYPYSGFGWGISYAYGPPFYGGYAQLPPRNAAPVELHVSPRKADVIVDGTNVGQARDFNSRAYPLWLKTGTHTLELGRPGYQTLRVKFEVKGGRAYRVHYELREGEGLDPRSSKRSRSLRRIRNQIEGAAASPDAGDQLVEPCRLIGSTSASLEVVSRTSFFLPAFMSMFPSNTPPSWITRFGFSSVISPTTRPVG